MSVPHVYGQSIRIFLVDGHAGGLTIAAIPNWSGSVVVSAAVDLPNVFARPEAGRAGCYILLSDGDAAQKPKAYIGQARKLRSRIATQAREKDWISRVALISTSDSTFTTGHYLALESRMIQIALKSARVIVENGNEPDEDAGYLGEADRADIESFLDKLRLVLPVLGFDLLKGEHRTEAADPLSQRLRLGEPVFYLEHQAGARARAVIVDGDLIVEAGSKANVAEFAHNNYGHLRRSLIEDGTLKLGEAGDLFEFTRDTPFNSPSAAAAVVLNRQNRGPQEWKVVGSGESMRDWQTNIRASVFGGDVEYEVEE